MRPDDIQALVQGRHADPFAVLGPHEANQGLAIRAFWSRARGITVVSPEGAPIAALARVHPEGLFEGVIDGATREKFDYRLRVEDGMGHAFTIDDPYRYGPVLTDFDLHLLAEGTHFPAWDRLGARPMTLGIRAGARPLGVRAGVHFAVGAPSARRVSVVGDFNGWDGRVLPMRKRTGGYWE